LNLLKAVVGLIALKVLPRREVLAAVLAFVMFLSPRAQHVN
jgi:hypothetical protein